MPARTSTLIRRRRRHEDSITMLFCTGGEPSVGSNAIVITSLLNAAEVDFACGVVVNTR
jgi:hypothetical protein